MKAFKGKDMPKNRVILNGWSSQPIHCPFCGEALLPNEQESCKHLLYIIAAGNFITRSARFNKLLGQEPGESDCWPEFGRVDKVRFGSPDEAATKVREALTAFVEFEIWSLTDAASIGFAALDEELAAPGYCGQSPYETAEIPTTEAQS